MNVDLAQELLNELGSSLENLETQHAALLQFLKDKGMVTDEEFAPYQAQAGKASSVRWRAARVRLDSLINKEKEKEERLAEKQQPRTPAAQTPAQEAPAQAQEQTPKDGKEARNNEGKDAAKDDTGAAKDGESEGNKRD